MYLECCKIAPANWARMWESWAAFALALQELEGEPDMRKEKESSPTEGTFIYYSFGDEKPGCSRRIRSRFRKTRFRQGAGVDVELRWNPILDSG